MLMLLFAMQALASSPETARTVNAFAGHWTGTAVATTPYDKPESFPWVLDCKPIAQNSGVSCTSFGKASIGRMDQTCLIAFDGALVHYMCVSSMGEVHDHRGSWGTDGITYEPFKGTMNGQAITEDVSTRFPSPGLIDHVSRTTLPDGGVINFEFKGKKSK